MSVPSATVIGDWLVERLATALRVSGSEIDRTVEFDALGVDSAAAVILVGELERWLARPLVPSLLWEHPSVAALARHLAEPGSDAAVQSTYAGIRDQSEPIAIVGVGCRFPMAPDPDAYWDLLSRGGDAIRPTPAIRRPTDAETARPGGYIDDVDTFDCEFFHVSRRAASMMDPQQRLLLEVTWEALERGCIDPGSLAGSRTGVFIGISGSEYLGRAEQSPEPDLHAVTGNAASIAANRLSYFLDLRGPSLAIDTACSSSLVALHLAVRSLRSGECTMAVAGGVSLLLWPWIDAALERAQMLAGDGRCKTFDAAADGYVRGEGCGIVVLKPLADARAAGDRILALVQGSAVSQDGRSNGITAPNGLAQQAAIEDALRDAGVDPAQLDYVEAHGTGTALGDPVEVQALGRAFGTAGARERPCLLGSVKTNIGHLEAAAGIAGVIKVVLALQHEEIPPNLHFRTPNPHLQIEQLPFRIPTTCVAWPRTAHPRRAGVSSFGFGGTNAHVILEEGPADEIQSAATPPPRHVVALSASCPAALAAIAKRLEDYLTDVPAVSLTDVSCSLNSGRQHLAHRAAIVAHSHAALLEALDAVRSVRAHPGVFQSLSARRAHCLAFLFTGQGSQYPGMARRLYETQPTFRHHIDQCAQVLGPLLDRPLLEILHGEDGSVLGSTRYTQPALFALEYALACLWRSWGVEPNVVLGHSVGEIIAACVAGAFPLEAGLRFVVERARLMQAVTIPGSMVAVAAGEKRVAVALAPHAGDVAVAAVNGPESTVISGEEHAVRAVLARLTAERVEWQPLAVSHAFHSPLMAPVCGAIEQAARDLPQHPLRIPLVSNLTGSLLPAGETIGAADWAAHARSAVQFADGMRTLRGVGCDALLELGPHPTLLGMGRQCIGDERTLWLPSLQRGRDDWEVMLATVGRLYVEGLPFDWRGFERDYPGRRMSLPTYPFQRRRCWSDEQRPKRSEAKAVAASISATARLSSSCPAQPRALMARQLDVVAKTIDGQLALLRRAAPPSEVPVAAGRMNGDRGFRQARGEPKKKEATFVNLPSPWRRSCSPQSGAATPPAAPAAEPILCLHQAVELQAARRPDAIAVRTKDATLTYRELNRIADGVAERIRTSMVGADRRVGIVADRLPEVLAGSLAILKAGGVCGWFRPSWTNGHAEMLNGHAPRVLLAGATLVGSLPRDAEVVVVDVEALRATPDDACCGVATASLDSPMCVTIDPDGGERALLRHRDALRLAVALDRHVGCDTTDVLLLADAVEGDVALVTQLWALSRGATILCVPVSELKERVVRRPPARRTPRIGLSFFGSYGREQRAAASYRDVIEAAVHADRCGMSAVWVPERHFDAFGGIFPSASVLCAALARETRRIQLRAGSVVLPLHHPIRVAEEWSVVDNLSNGRVGVSFASGWHPRDFVLAPDVYASRRESMLRGLAVVQRLWRGDAIEAAGPDGKVTEVRLHPLPVQGRLPTWLTSVNSAETWAKAGELGAGVLTNLMSQTLKDVERNLTVYHSSLQRHGHAPGTGTVTVMLHTFVAEDAADARAQARAPFVAYLRSAVDVFKSFVGVHGTALEDDLTDEDVEWLLSAAYDRYTTTNALIGSPATCRSVLEHLAEIGVDEVACLVDFGLDHTTVMQGLERLSALIGLDGETASPEARWWPRPSLVLCSPATLDAIDGGKSPERALDGVRAVLLLGDRASAASDAVPTARVWTETDLHTWLGSNGGAAA